MKMIEFYTLLLLIIISISQSAGLGMAMGWGQHTLGVWDVSDVLRHVPLEVKQDKFNGNSNYFTTFVNKKNNGQGYLDTCKGDSGGPLVHLNPETKRWTIIGTSSRQQRNCYDGSTVASPASDSVSIWNKVTAHLDWIKKTLAEA